MTDLTRLDIAIAEASNFLKLARELRPKLNRYEYLTALDRLMGYQDKNLAYPIDEAAKVRAKSLDLSRALVDLRRKQEKRI